MVKKLEERLKEVREKHHREIEDFRKKLDWRMVELMQNKGTRVIIRADREGIDGEYEKRRSGDVTRDFVELARVYSEHGERMLDKLINDPIYKAEVDALTKEINDLKNEISLLDKEIEAEEAKER